MRRANEHRLARAAATVGDAAHARVHGREHKRRVDGLVVHHARHGKRGTRGNATSSRSERRRGSAPHGSGDARPETPRARDGGLVLKARGPRVAEGGVHARAEARASSVRLVAPEKTHGPGVGDGEGYSRDGARRGRRPLLPPRGRVIVFITTERKSRAVSSTPSLVHTRRASHSARRWLRRYATISADSNISCAGVVGILQTARGTGRRPVFAWSSSRFLLPRGAVSHDVGNGELRQRFAHSLGEMDSPRTSTTRGVARGRPPRRRRRRETAARGAARGRATAAA